MFNIFRRVDSPNLYIEILDATLTKEFNAETTCDLYKEIIKFLSEEYIKQNGDAILATMNLEKIKNSLVGKIAENLVDRLFNKEPSNAQL